VGSIDVNSREYQADFANVPKLVFIDTSQVDGGGLNHNTFATSPRIVQLIGERLIAGQAITDGDGASPSDAAASLGTAARTLVSTPFLILNHASAAAH
jgi:esterase/lipase superfamily enzyme